MPESGSIAPVPHVAPGHPYSPLPSWSDIGRAARRQQRPDLPGIALREERQWELLAQLHLHYPRLERWLLSATPRRFELRNPWFSGSDAITLGLMLLHRPPRRVVEVGSGFSSALLLDLNDCFFDTQLSIKLIDPDQGRLDACLAKTVDGAQRWPVPVQDVPFDCFQRLDQDDVLLIDSSHVVKAGSDVHHLFFSIFPRLKVGVRIHIHDIFFPFEYPEEWLRLGCSLNEAYALQALLIGNRQLRILFWNDFLQRCDSDWFRVHWPLATTTMQTGGLWLECH